MKMRYFHEGNINDRDLVGRILSEHQIRSVVHFAGHIVVPESVVDPGKYYANNVVGSLNLIEASIAAGVSNFVFSSSAAVYGIPANCPVDEAAELEPINPYGASKLMTEWTLRDLARATDGAFNYVALRYFNVAGAHMGGKLGQATPEATHLIKVACQAACGVRDSMSVFGNDYPTPDGTGVRDYIHVDDLASAHLDALAYLSQGNPSTILNCGYGHGYSVKQVIECVKSVSNTDFPVRVEGRRDGDPPELVADNTRIRREFNWKPKYNDLDTICRSAYEWESRLNERFPADPD